MGKSPTAPWRGDKDQPGPFLPGRFSPGLAKAKPVVLQRGRSPNLGLHLQGVGSGSAGWGYMHTGQHPRRSHSRALTAEADGRMDEALGAWGCRQEHGCPLCNLSAGPPQPLGTTECRHQPHRIPPHTAALPGQAGAPLSQTLRPDRCSVRTPSPMPGSAGRCVTPSFRLRDGVQWGTQMGGLRRGRAIPADAAGLPCVVDLPQVVQRLRLGVLEEVSLALRGGNQGLTDHRPPCWPPARREVRGVTGHHPRGLGRGPRSPSPSAP